MYSGQELHVEEHGGGAPPPYPQDQRRPPSAFRVLVRAFIAACTVVVFVALLVWLIYRPRTIQVAVDEATLSRFALNTRASPRPVLSFNLTAGLTIRNPSRRTAVYYDVLWAEGFYRAERFGRAALPRRSDAVRAVLVGSSDAGAWDAGAFGGDNQTGVFPVDLWVAGAVRYKYGGLMTTSATMLSARCPLALKLMAASSRVECTVISF
uniref:Late embryogenesis abundant protein LEA-2 subgroup domain-containing protein n=1 Tax=Oryza brachyantha TaxID=4533 RepID=J3L647_ORYBR